MYLSQCIGIGQYSLDTQHEKCFYWPEFVLNLRIMKYISFRSSFLFIKNIHFDGIIQKNIRKKCTNFEANVSFIVSKILRLCP